MSGSLTLSTTTRVYTHALRFLSRPLRHYKVLILVVAISVIFAPQVSPSDHELNIEPLTAFNRVYDNPAYVYPPQALTFMMPFLFVGARFTRLLTVVLIGIFGMSRDWTVSRFLITILNPIFVYVMMFTNIDVFIVLLPLLFFDRVNTLGKALFLSLLMLKPQMTVFYAIYLVIHYGAWRAAIFGALFTLAHFAILSPDGQLLGLEWIDNILNPTDYNAAAWGDNALGVRWLVFAIFPLAYYLHHKNWTKDHSIASLLIFAMTISPYASFQSVLVAVTILSSGLVTLIHWGLVAAGVYSSDWYVIVALLLGGYHILLPTTTRILAKGSAKTPFTGDPVAELTHG